MKNEKIDWEMQKIIKEYEGELIIDSKAIENAREFSRWLTKSWVDNYSLSLENKDAFLFEWSDSFIKGICSAYIIDERIIWANYTPKLNRSYGELFFNRNGVIKLCEIFDIFNN